MSVPPSIAVFVDIHGNVPGVPHDLVIRTAGTLPLANFYRALGVDIVAGTTADGTPMYLGGTVGLALTILPAAETAPVGIGKLHFLVGDVDAAVRLAKAEGGRVVRQVTPQQRRAMVTDPDGRNVILAERSAFASQVEGSDAAPGRESDETLAGTGRSASGPASSYTAPVSQFDSARALHRSMQIHRIGAGANLVGHLLLAGWIFFIIGLDLTGAPQVIIRELTAWRGTMARLTILGFCFLAVSRGACAGDFGRAGGIIRPLIAIGIDLLNLSIVLGLWGFDRSSWFVILVLYYVSSILFGSYLTCVATAVGFEQTATTAQRANAATFTALLISAVVGLGMTGFWNSGPWQIGVGIVGAALAIALTSQISLSLSYLIHSARALFQAGGNV